MEKANPDSLADSTFVLPPVPADPGRAEALPLIKAVREALQEQAKKAREVLEKNPRLHNETARLVRATLEGAQYRAELLLQAELALGGGLRE